MFNVCMRILNNKDDAEDVLQNSFISAFGNIQSFDSNKASFGTWLKRIVVNNSIDAFKRSKINWVPIDEMEDPGDEAGDEEIEYTVENILAGIQQLADGYRIVLILYLFEDHTHKMIAEKLKISEGTSKSQYARARKKLIEFITQKPGS